MDIRTEELYIESYRAQWDVPEKPGLYACISTDCYSIGCNLCLKYKNLSYTYQYLQDLPHILKYFKKRLCYENVRDCIITTH